MLTVIKIIITTVLLSTLLVVTTNVEARLKYYRYNSNIPMVEMSLNMMVAMGVLEQIPRQLVHDGNPYSRLTTAQYGPYSRNLYGYPINSRYYNNRLYDSYLGGLTSPYSRNYGSPYGYTPGNLRGGAWGNQWSNQWGSPWSNQWGDQWSNPWSGAYGNQPYRSWNYPSGSLGGNQFNNPWGSSWNNQWMNPWTSPWSNTMTNPFSGPFGGMGGWPVTPGYSSMPMSPNSVFGGNRSRNNPLRSGRPVLIKYRKEDGSIGNRPPSFRHTSRAGHRNGEYRTNSRKSDRRLDGIWVGDTGETLGIRGSDFLWHDGKNQYVNGKLSKSPTTIQVMIDGANEVVRYRYKFLRNQLVIMSMDGKVRRFSRKPFLQSSHTVPEPHASYSSYKPGSNTSHVSYSKYGSSLATPLTKYPHNKSDSGASIPAYTSKRPDSVVPLKSFSSERSNFRNPLIPFATESSYKDIPTAANAAEKGNNQDIPASDTNGSTASISGMSTDSGDESGKGYKRAPEITHDPYVATSTAVYSKDMPYKQQPPTPYSNETYYKTVPITPGLTNGDDKWQPLTPHSSYDAPAGFSAATFSKHKDDNPAKITTSSGDGADAVVSSVSYASAASNIVNPRPLASARFDPNVYLYSYMKDTDYLGAPIASYSRDKSNIWVSSSTFPANGYSSVSSKAAVKDRSSNIWKAK